MCEETGAKFMPQKVEIDGVEQEVYLSDEVKDLKAGHDANAGKRETVEQFNKLKESLELGEGESIEDKLQDMKDSVNPNWKATRLKMKVMQEQLREQGVEVDDDGKVVENKQSLTSEEITKIAEDATDKRNLDARKADALSKYSDDEKKSLEPFIDKLMLGGGSFEENLEIAVLKLFPDKSTEQNKKVFNNVMGGNNPAFNIDKKDYSDSDNGKQTGKAMGLRFAQEDNNKK